MSPTADAPYLSSPDSSDLGFEDDPLLEKRMGQATGATSGEDGDARDWKARPSEGGARRRRQMLACGAAILTAGVLAAVYVSTHALRLPTSIFPSTQSAPSGVTQYEYVASWRSTPLEEEGWVRKPVELPQELLERENKTDYNSVFRSIIATPHSDPNYVAVRVVAQFWAFPFDRFEDIHHRGPAFLDDPKHNNFTLRLEVFNALSNGETLEARLHHYDWKYVEFLIPARHMQLSTTKEDLRRFPVRFSLEWEGETAVAYEAELQQSWTPYSRQAICTRPLFGGMSPLDYKEWRLHHGAMGFDIVHWGSRDAEMARDLERLNRLTGYQDTFTYFPRFEERADNDFWEEHFTNNDCWSTYSHAAEFMGVWDHDEFFSPAHTSDIAWTRPAVEQWLDDLDLGITAVNLPWWWINKPDFGPMPVATLLEAQPDLDEQALEDIAALKQNGNGLYSQPKGGMYFTTKSLYRTSRTTSAKVHHGAPCCGQTQKWGVQFAVYHARQKQKIWKGAFKPWEVSPSLVAFWRDLGARLRQIEEKAVP